MLPGSNFSVSIIKQLATVVVKPIFKHWHFDLCYSIIFCHKKGTTYYVQQYVTQLAAAGQSILVRPCRGICNDCMVRTNFRTTRQVTWTPMHAHAASSFRHRRWRQVALGTCRRLSRKLRAGVELAERELETEHDYTHKDKFYTSSEHG